MKEIRDGSCNIRDPLAKKREIFKKVFLARYPPVLGEWFRRTFPDAQVRLAPQPPKTNLIFRVGSSPELRIFAPRRMYPWRATIED